MFCFDISGAEARQSQTIKSVLFFKLARYIGIKKNILIYKHTLSWNEKSSFLLTPKPQSKSKFAST